MASRRIQRLRKAGGLIVGFSLAIWSIGGPESAINALRDMVNFVLIGTGYEAAQWINAEFLATPVRLMGGLAAIGLLIWAFWPERQVTPPHVYTPLANPPGSSTDMIIGGRAEDEAGVTIGPMPTAEALKVFAAPTQEYVTLDDAGRWLYENASQRIRDSLRAGVPSPFDSIAAHGAAFFRTLWSQGGCDLYGRWETGLPMERIDYKDGEFSAFESVFGSDRRKPIDLSVLRQDLRSVLDHYEREEPISARDVVRVVRDTPLGEALMFAATGQWGLGPMADGGGHLEALGAALRDFRQYAHDGVITVWGQSDNYGVWQRIAPDYWIDHSVDLLDILRAESRTRANNRISQAPLFKALMVCRAEFEAEWRDD